MNALTNPFSVKYAMMAVGMPTIKENKIVFPTLA